MKKIILIFTLLIFSSCSELPIKENSVLKSSNLKEEPKAQTQTPKEIAYGQCKEENLTACKSWLKLGGDLEEYDSTFQERFCPKISLKACELIGNFYKENDQLLSAFEYYKKGCSSKNITSCKKAETLKKDADEIKLIIKKNDLHEAKLAKYSKGCEEGKGRDCFELAGLSKENPIYNVKKACEYKYLPACTMLHEAALKNDDVYLDLEASKGLCSISLKWCSYYQSVQARKDALESQADNRRYQARMEQYEARKAESERQRIFYEQQRANQQRLNESVMGLARAAGYQDPTPQPRQTNCHTVARRNGDQTYYDTQCN